MRSGVTIAPALLLGSTSCTKVQQLKNFLSSCPSTGPTRETLFSQHLVPVDLDVYYAELFTTAGDAPRREVVRVATDNKIFPLYHFGPMGTVGGKRLLVVAAVHGNEISGSLAIPQIFRELREQPDAYAGVEVHVIAPANPVGLYHLSRYNADGCDINRDFRAFRTPEARTIRDVFLAVRPDLEIALHEGPQDGFFLFATEIVSPGTAAGVVNAVDTKGIPSRPRVCSGPSFHSTVRDSLPRDRSRPGPSASCASTRCPCLRSHTAWARSDNGDALVSDRS